MLCRAQVVANGAKAEERWKRFAVAAPSAQLAFPAAGFADLGANILHQRLRIFVRQDCIDRHSHYLVRFVSRGHGERLVHRHDAQLMIGDDNAFGEMPQCVGIDPQLLFREPTICDLQVHNDGGVCSCRVRDRCDHHAEPAFLRTAAGRVLNCETAALPVQDLPESLDDPRDLLDALTLGVAAHLDIVDPGSALGVVEAARGSGRPPGLVDRHHLACVIEQSDVRGERVQDGAVQFRELPLMSLAHLQRHSGLQLFGHIFGDAVDAHDPLLDLDRNCGNAQLHARAAGAHIVSAKVLRLSGAQSLEGGCYGRPLRRRQQRREGPATQFVLRVSQQLLAGLIHGNEASGQVQCIDSVRMMEEQRSILLLRKLPLTLSATFFLALFAHAQCVRHCGGQTRHTILQ